METLFWPIVLVLLGVLLIFMEVFVPSGGIIALFAMSAVIASIAVGFTHGLKTGTLVLMIDIIVVPLSAGLAFKTWRHSPFGRMIINRRPESEAEVLPDTDEYRFRKEMIGKRGTAKTPLLPSGDVVIDGRTYDAVSKGMSIEEGQPIEIVEVSTLRLVVRPLSDAERAAADEADASPSSPDDVLSTPIDALGIDPLDDPLA